MLMRPPPLYGNMSGEPDLVQPVGGGKGELHQTYSATDAISESFDGMTAGDQDFAEKIAEAMAICLKLSNNPGSDSLFTDGVIGSRPAKVFAAGDVYNNTNMEYIMLVYDKDDTLWS